MQFGNLGFMEIMIILVVFLLVFGAKRLPEIGQSMGKGIREFKKSISDVDKELREPSRDDRLDRRDAREPDRLPRETRDEDRPDPKRLIG
jgi:sec-independent protein translocase protein TatA